MDAELTTIPENQRDPSLARKNGRIARREAPGQLWQVPVFVLGLCALIGVWVGRPFWRDADAIRLERQLAGIRQTLTQSPADGRQALALGQDLLSRCERFPQRTGEAYFLLGSSYLSASASETDAVEADYLRLKAREHLEEAEALGVPEADRAPLWYRLGKLWYQMGVKPQRAIDYLSRSVEEGADDRVEGYGMLAQAYLRLSPPNVRAALEANKKRLTLPIESDEELASARLLHGELLLQLEDAAEARKVLARIEPTAPPHILTRARYLRAQSCQQEGLWTEAAQLWEEVLTDRQATGLETARVCYLLGVCYRKLDKPAEAARVWESALAHKGEEAQAAAFSLAELRLQGANSAGAFECFEQALRETTGPAGYRNSLLSLPDARQLMEQGCQRYREIGDHDRARRLSRLYEKLALPGAAHEQRGQTEEAWAGALRAAGNDAEARAHLREAAAAYETVADAHPGRPEQAQWLRRSADRSLQAQDYPKALAALRRFREAAEGASEQVGEGWLHEAQIHQKLHDKNNAVIAYRKCIEFPGSSAYEARYQLAMIDIEDGKMDDAVEALKQNLELMRPAPDDEIYKKTLYTLADLLYRIGNHRLASLRFQEALDRYPADARAVEMRLQLADAYRRLAVQESENLRGIGLTQEAQEHYRGEYRKWLKMASANYQKLADDLAARRAKGSLPEKEDAVLRKAEFALGECRFDLGQYDEALRHYEILAARYHHQIENLIALKQVWRCHWVMRQPDKARETVKQVRTVLQEMDEKAFLDSSDKQTRKDWEQWLEWAGKQ